MTIDSLTEETPMDLDRDLIDLYRGIVREHLERIEVSYLKALRDGADDPAVLLLDPLVAEARRIADAACNAHSVARLVETARERDCCAILTWGVPRAFAAELLSANFPDVAVAILRPGAAADSYWTIAVLGAGAWPFPMPPVSAADRAEWCAGVGDADRGDVVPGPGGERP
jgi:hypothetical protein